MKRLLGLLLLLALAIPGANAARRGTGSNYMNFGSAASLDNLTKFTLCTWIRFPDWSTIYHVMAKTQGAPYTNQRSFFYTDATFSGSFVTGIRDGGGFHQAISAPTNGTLSANVWYHVSVTYDDSGDRKVRHYVNGTEVSYGTQTAATGALNDDSGASVGVFGSVVDSGFWSGDLHHVTLWSGIILNQAEMMFHRAGGNPQPNSQVLNVMMIRGANGDELDWSPAKNNGNAVNTFAVVDTPPGWGLDFRR